MKARILVVDDNLLNRKLALHLLEMEGYEVLQCGDAEEVLELLAHDATPDLILMDIALPGMDGLTLTRQLRKEGRYTGVPIVAMTAFAMKGDEEKALQAGCDGYITKPIDTRRLPQQVEEILQRRPKPRAPLTVMVVEDYRVDLKLAGERLRMAGHVALSSESAELALQRLNAEQPDVVLLDLNLPGMDGLAFVRQIRSDPATARMPVVAVTAFPNHYDEAELLSAGCTAYLIKPVDVHRLVEELERAVPR